MFKAYSKEPLVYNFKKAPELEIELRMPNASDEVALERFLQKEPVMFEAIVYQIALLALRTNIVDEEDDPLFGVDSGLGDRILSIYQMPGEMIEELGEALVEFYPQWKLTA
jgi:hypothetical protein